MNRKRGEGRAVRWAVITMLTCVCAGGTARGASAAEGGGKAVEARAYYLPEGITTETQRGMPFGAGDVIVVEPGLCVIVADAGRLDAWERAEGGPAREVRALRIFNLNDDLFEDIERSGESLRVWPKRIVEGVRIMLDKGRAPDAAGTWMEFDEQRLQLCVIDTAEQVERVEAYFAGLPELGVPKRIIHLADAEATDVAGRVNPDLQPHGEIAMRLTAGERRVFAGRDWIKLEACEPGATGEAGGAVQAMLAGSVPFMPGEAVALRLTEAEPKQARQWVFTAESITPLTARIRIRFLDPQTQGAPAVLVPLPRLRAVMVYYRDEATRDQAVREIELLDRKARAANADDTSE